MVPKVRKQMLNRDQLLKPIPLKTETVEIKDWGTFKIKQLSQSAQAKYHAWTMPKGKECPVRSSQRHLKMIVLCVVSEDGKPLLTDDDIDQLASQPATVIDDLIKEVLTINGWLDDEDSEGLLEK